jgi:hypothetical protein
MTDDTIPQDTLYIPQGGTFYHAWPLIDADTGAAADVTSGWTARCQIRESYGGAVITDFHSDRVGHFGWPGVITFDADSNLIMTLDAVTTAALDPISNAVFDLVMRDSSGYDYVIVQGRAHVLPEVTTDH